MRAKMSNEQPWDDPWDGSEADHQMRQYYRLKGMVEDGAIHPPAATVSPMAGPMSPARPFWVRVRIAWQVLRHG